MNEQENILNMRELGKIEDAGNVVRGGRIDHYWGKEGINYKFKALFDEAPEHAWLFDAQKALEHFNLRSIEFGNWMSQEDRANFLYASMLSLHHLAKLFKVKDSLIGFGGKLSISLGARGSGSAAGHYEPNPYSVINITKTKGIGVLAHEYAHALDNIISFHTKGKRQTYVSGGRTTRKGYNEDIAKKGNFFEKKFEEFYNILYFTDKGTPTEFAEKLSKLDDYWNFRNEVFARTMEVYVSEKLQARKIKDGFLVRGLSKKAYPTPKEVRKVTTIINSIVKSGFEILKKKGLGGFTLDEIDYKGFRKTIKENASLDDTLENMKRIAYRDTYQVERLASQLEGYNIKETAQNIWIYLRANTRYKLDTKGIEELRTPNRSLVDGSRGLTDHQSGIDCDDYTILISAILLNLNINHAFRVVSYSENSPYEHIYPVAYDTDGTPYVIDVVPEIPHFNYEAQPIKKLKTVNMQLQELSGVNNTDHKTELMEALNETFTLSGLNDESDHILEAHFLSGLKEVESESEADIVLSGADISELYERSILAEINKARNLLIEEQRKPGILSQTINVGQELERINLLMENWGDENERFEIINKAIEDSAYFNFYKSLRLAIEQSEENLLNGIDDEPIYLARDMAEYDLSDLIEDETVGLFKKGGQLRKFFKKVGTGAKKVAKAVVRYNPATIGVRSAILLVLKTNVNKIASRLIYGCLTEAQAQAQGLDLNEWRKLQVAVSKAEQFFTKIGGKSENFRKAIVKGRASKVTNLSLNGIDLGVVATATATTAAGGFMLFVKKLLSNINPQKLFAKIKERRANKRADKANSLVDESDFENPETLTNRSTESSDEDKQVATPLPKTKERTMLDNLKDFWDRNKKKIIAISVGGVIALVIIIIALKWKKRKEEKEKRSLAGIKAAKTRAKNRKALGTAKKAPTTRKRTPQLKGRATTPKLPPKTVGSASKRANGKRLQLMHKKAKELRKKHPKTKYSTLLKRASKLI